MKKFFVMPFYFIVLAACSLAFSREKISNKDVCLKDDIEAIVEVFNEMSQNNGTDLKVDPNNVKLYGTCDSVDLHYVILMVPIKLAKIQKRGECEIDIQYTETVKRMDSFRDTIINICPDNLSNLAASPSRLFLFQSFPSSGFHLIVPKIQQTSWAMVEIHDARGRLLHENFQHFNGTILEFDWSPATGILGPYFITVSLGKGSEIFKKRTGSFFLNL